MANRKRKTFLDRLDQQSLSSLGLGTLVVIIVGLLIFNYFSKIKRAPTPPEAIVPEEKVEAEVEEKEEKPSFEFEPVELPTEHTVTKGEHLWGLAKRYYNDGYKWTKIAQENRLPNPNLIRPRNKLTIPKIEVAEKPEEKPTEKLEERIKTLGGKIEGNEYTVQRGDDLCKIALRAYGDCTKGWEIARENRLANPNLIHAGNVLKLPRD